MRVVGILWTALVGAVAAPDGAEASRASPPDSADEKAPESETSSEVEREAPPLDERGDPVLPYAGESAQPEEELRWADETAEETPVEWSDETPSEPEVPRAAGHERPPPAGAALDRQDARAHRREQLRGYQPSPQRFELELKFGPYVPDVDLDYAGGGAGPYESIFGETNDRGEAIDDPKPGLMSAIAFEWQFVHLAGPFSLAAQLGYFRAKAHALIAEPDADSSTVRSSADTARFHVMPTSLSIGYRFEYLADRFRVPIVPYAKIGIAYGFWWATDGNRNISVNDAGEKGRGGTWGWQINAGGMLRLDVFDSGNGNDLDRNTGINHAYILAEFQRIRLDDFGKHRGVNVGDSTWLLGLAIEF